jgi:pilus assembly protein Flp/PilA
MANLTQFKFQTLNEAVALKPGERRPFGVDPIVQRKAKGPMDKIMQYLGDESGASAAEYALILALIALVIIGAVTTLGGNINSIFGKASTSI